MVATLQIGEHTRLLGCQGSADIEGIWVGKYSAEICWSVECDQEHPVLWERDCPAFGSHLVYLPQVRRLVSWDYFAAMCRLPQSLQRRGLMGCSGLLISAHGRCVASQPEISLSISIIYIYNIIYDISIIHIQMTPGQVSEAPLCSSSHLFFQVSPGDWSSNC